MLGRHRHVGLEFARPPAFGAIAACKQPVDGAVERVRCVERAQRVLDASASRRARCQQAARRAAADGRFHRVGPAGVGPRAGDRDARVGRALRGARACPSGGSYVASGLRVTALRDESRVAQGGRNACTSRHASASSSAVGMAQIFVGGAEAAAQIARRLFEDPLQRRLERGREIEADAARRRATGARRRSETARTRRGRDAVARGVARAVRAACARRHGQHDGVERSRAVSPSSVAASTPSLAAAVDAEHRPSTGARHRVVRRPRRRDARAALFEKPKRAAPASRKKAGPQHEHRVGGSDAIERRVERRE